MADRGPAECTALVAAAPGLPAFVVAALRRLAELCARLPWRTRPRSTDWGTAACCSAKRVRCHEQQVQGARART